MSSTNSTSSTTSPSSSSIPSSSPPSSSSSSSSPSSSASSSSPSSSLGSSSSSSSSSSSATSTSSSSTTSTLTASLTTSVQATLVSTSANGQVFTTVVETQSILPPGATVTAASESSGSSDSHTGAIVGGAVGGGAGLIIIVLLITIWWKRHRQRQRSLDAFDGNFNPDRIVTQKPVKGEPKDFRGQGPTLPDIPNTGLEDDGMGGRLAGSMVGAGVVSPYPLYQPTHDGSSHASPEMSAQHTESSGRTRPASSSTGIPASVYTAAYGHNYPGADGPASASQQLPNPFGPESVVSSSTNSHSASPAAGHNRFNVANPDPGFVGGFVPGDLAGRGAKFAAGPSGAGRSREILVHQDGGRVQDGAVEEEEEGPDEIPPTYDSLHVAPEGSSAPQAREKR
ncbi:hypothetical protein D9757_008063 [Collybiopsis confluens]|uniref:Uncharacterized protein n=1 Tax=Collybiopsis confluens TaxID=2823264 RepID=A0A8H5M1T5_9AGAR|nr:hypothetical protein D9757_008063 [Collybiopsis confluens]